MFESASKLILFYKLQLFLIINNFFTFKKLTCFCACVFNDCIDVIPIQKCHVTL